MSDATPAQNAASTAPAANQPVSSPTSAPTSGIAENWAKSWINSDFSLNPSALDRLPDDLKPLRPTLERQNKFDGVLHVLNHNLKLAGKKAPAPLPENSDPEVVAERKALIDAMNGVPKEAKDYGITKEKFDAAFPDAHWSQPLADEVSSWAFKNSVSPAAARELVGIQMNFVKGQLAEQAKAETAFWNEEQQKFSSLIQQRNLSADKADALMQKGAVALGLNLEDPQTKLMMKGATARLMAINHAIAIGEDKTVTGDSSGSAAGRNYGDLAKSIRSDPANPLYAPFWNTDGRYSATDHEQAVAKFHEFLRLDDEQKRRQK